MEGIWKRAFGKGLLEEGKFLEGNWHAPRRTSFIGLGIYMLIVSKKFLPLDGASSVKFLDYAISFVPITKLVINLY